MGTLIYPKMKIMMTITMLGVPSIKIFSFGLSSASTSFSNSYSDAVLQDVVLINLMDDYSRLPPWVGEPIKMITKTVMDRRIPINNNLKNRTARFRTYSNSISAYSAP